MMKSVWIVMRDEGYGDHWSIAAYPEKELAEIHAAEANKKVNCHIVEELPFFRHYDEFLEQGGE